jgi:hypothetical protein
MTYFRAAILFPILCLLIAQTALAQTPLMPPPYHFFSTSVTITNPIVNAGDMENAIVGYSGYDATQNIFTGATPVNLTWGTGSSWFNNNMYVYNNSTVTVNGGDPNDLAGHPGGEIQTCTMWLMDGSTANVSGQGFVYALNDKGFGNINVSGGTIGLALGNATFGGLTLDFSSSAIISGGTITALSVLDDATATISGGTIGSIAAQTDDGTIDSTAVITTNGGVNVTGAVSIADGATMNINGGQFTSVSAGNGSTVKVTDGTLTGALVATSNTVAPSASTVTLDGGTVGSLGVGVLGPGSATVSMGSGIVLGDASAQTGGVMNLTGGNILGSVTASTNSTITMSGSISVAGNATENAATLNINSGANIAGNLTAQDGKLNMSGGNVIGSLSAQGAAVVSLSDGNIGGLQVQNSATVIMSDGAISGQSNVANSGQLYISGGSTSGLSVHDGGIINWSAGSNSGDLDTFNSSTVFITGSVALEGALNTHNGSKVFISSGTITGGVNAYDTSIITSSGGLILGGSGAINVYNSARFIWSGGTITSSGITSNSITPGAHPLTSNQVPIYVHDNSTLEVDGINLNAALLDPNNNNGMYSEYQVNGFFGDGTPVPSGADFFVANPTAGAPAPTFQLAATPQKWNVAGGSWGSTANWTPAIVADEPGSIADFSGITVSATITLDGDHSVGQLDINNTGNSVTIASGTSGTLNLNNNGSDAAINITGNHQILAPIMGQDNTDITISANSSLTLANGITMAGSKTLTLTSSNLGTLSIPNTSTITGNVVASGGTVDIEGGAINGTLAAQGNSLITLGSGTISGMVTAQDNSSVTLTSGSLQGGLQLLNSAIVSVNGGSIAGAPNTANNSVLYLNGGTTEGVEINNFSQVLISGAEIDGDVDTYDNSATHFYSGVIAGNINLYNSSVFTMQADYPGATGLNANQRSANAHPLTDPAPQNAIYVNDSALLYLSGINLSSSLIDAHNSDGMYSEYQLAGYYSDGTPIPAGVDFFVQNSTGAAFQLQGSGQFWNIDTGGSWGNAANWAPSIVPDGVSQFAEFDSGDTPATITMDGSHTLGQLTIYGEEPFTIAQGTGGTLTLNNNGQGVSIDITGHHEIAAPVVAQELTNIQLEADTDPNTGLPSNSTLTLTDGITVATNQELQILGPGTLSTAFLHGGSLTIREGGTLAMIPNGTPAEVSTVQFLSIDVSSGSVLDVANNDLIIKKSAISSVMQLIQSGYDGGTWSGPGIISSLANSNHTLGVLTGAQFLALHPGEKFDGNTVASTDVLIKYTLDGDTNLDGVIDANDYLAIDNGFNQQLRDWPDGDFNYDGVINGDDYTLIDNAFNTQNSTSLAVTSTSPAEMIATDTAQISEPSISSVPEPGSFALLITVSAGLFTRQRRRAQRQISA